MIIIGFDVSSSTVGWAVESINNNIVRNIIDSDGHSIALVYSGYAPDYNVIQENTLLHINNPTVLDISIQNTATKGVDSIELINQPILTYNFTGKGTSSLIVENTSTGKISFIGFITGNGTNFNNDVKIESNLVTINAATKPMFNKSATITLYNVPVFSDPVTYRNDGECGSYCGTLTYSGNQVYTFLVSGWSNYSVGQRISIYTFLCNLQDILPFYTLQNYCTIMNKTKYSLEQNTVYNSFKTTNDTTCDMDISTTVLNYGSTCDLLRYQKESLHGLATSNTTTGNFTYSSVNLYGQVDTYSYTN